MPLTKSATEGGFKRIWVDYAVRGTARVTWEMRHDFRDALPHSFQLQANPNHEEPDGWTDVGVAADNTDFALDDTQRQFGKTLRIAYRVVCTTSEDTYTSEPAQVLGLLSKRQWLMARAIIRRAQLRATGFESFQGYLFKRKLHGTRCVACIDPVTHETTNSACDTCKGTGRTDGYWRAATNTMFDLTPEPEDTRRSERGTVNDAVLGGSLIGIPMVARNDVWVDGNSDRRYFFHKVTPTAELNRVPLIVRAELRLAEFSDVIYSVDLEEGS